MKLNHVWIVILYRLPNNWIQYELSDEIRMLLTEAKAAMMTLVNMPYQRRWLEHLQEVQLKMEVAGTTKIEGADFGEGELELVFADENESLITRSQKQAMAAKRAYNWIAQLPRDIPIDLNLIKDLHRRMVVGADDDHCPPGVIRKRDQNVIFGTPQHRGAAGGQECEEALQRLETALREDFKNHDILVQALALHYHFASIHPFLDGNGRTARAVEALILRRAGVTENLFIAMSNYYYDEKQSYLKTLSEVRHRDHDLTPFLRFGLKGIKVQFERLFSAIKENIKKALFRDTMRELFGRLKTPRKRVITDRQMAILEVLLDSKPRDYNELYDAVRTHYSKLTAPLKGYTRDLVSLLQIDAIIMKDLEKDGSKMLEFRVNLDWPTQVTQTKFMEAMKKMPKAKSLKFSAPTV